MSKIQQFRTFIAAMVTIVGALGLAFLGAISKPEMVPMLLTTLAMIVLPAIGILAGRSILKKDTQ